MTRPGFAALRVLADPAAMNVLGRIAGRLRAAGYQNQVLQAGDAVIDAASQLALGHPVPATELAEKEVVALVSSGAADRDGIHVAPRFSLFASGQTLVLIPHDGFDDPGRVYFGQDSLWLADTASRFPSGGAMADLGTGPGTVAALLASRFDAVVATDIDDRTTACAAITFSLNRRAGGQPAAAACRTDVGTGLRTGAFSLVTANPPWMPSLDRDIYGPRRIFSEGGETGFELPRRFAVEGASLLAPDGVLVMLALDAIWQDGQRPLHSLGRGLQRLGYEVAIIPSGVDEPWRGTPIEPAARFAGIRAAVHVALVVHRPPTAGATSADGFGPDGATEQRPEEPVGHQFLGHIVGR